MKKMKKQFCILLCVVLAFALPVTSFASVAINGNVFVDDCGNIYLFGQMDKEVYDAGISLKGEDPNSLLSLKGGEYKGKIGENYKTAFDRAKATNGQFGMKLKNIRWAVESPTVTVTPYWQLAENGEIIFGTPISVSNTLPATSVEESPRLTNVSFGDAYVAPTFNSEVYDYYVSDISKLDQNSISGTDGASYTVQNTDNSVIITVSKNAKQKVYTFVEKEKRETTDVDVFCNENGSIKLSYPDESSGKNEDYIALRAYDHNSRYKTVYDSFAIIKFDLSDYNIDPYSDAIFTYGILLRDDTFTGYGNAKYAVYEVENLKDYASSWTEKEVTYNKTMGLDNSMKLGEKIAVNSWDYTVDPNASNSLYGDNAEYKTSIISVNIKDYIAKQLQKGNKIINLAITVDQSTDWQAVLQSGGTVPGVNSYLWGLTFKGASDASKQVVPHLKFKNKVLSDNAVDSVSVPSGSQLVPSFNEKTTDYIIGVSDNSVVEPSFVLKDGATKTVVTASGINGTTTVKVKAESGKETTYNFKYMSLPKNSTPANTDCYISNTEIGNYDAEKAKAAMPDAVNSLARPSWEWNNVVNIPKTDNNASYVRIYTRKDTKDYDRYLLIKYDFRNKPIDIFSPVVFGCGIRTDRALPGTKLAVAGVTFTDEIDWDPETTCTANTINDKTMIIGDEVAVETVGDKQWKANDEFNHYILRFDITNYVQGEFAKGNSIVNFIIKVSDDNTVWDSNGYSDNVITTLIGSWNGTGVALRTLFYNQRVLSNETVDSISAPENTLMAPEFCKDIKDYIIGVSDGNVAEPIVTLKGSAEKQVTLAPDINGVTTVKVTAESGKEDIYNFRYINRIQNPQDANTDCYISNTEIGSYDAEKAKAAMPDALNILNCVSYNASEVTTVLNTQGNIAIPVASYDGNKSNDRYVLVKYDFRNKPIDIFSPIVFGCGMAYDDLKVGTKLAVAGVTFTDEIDWNPETTCAANTINDKTMIIGDEVAVETVGDKQWKANDDYNHYILRFDITNYVQSEFAKGNKIINFIIKVSDENTIWSSDGSSFNFITSLIGSWNGTGVALRTLYYKN